MAKIKYTSSGSSYKESAQMITEDIVQKFFERTGEARRKDEKSGEETDN